ncbi:MAG: hypothetical protein ACOYI8_07575 [Christensenellales bacterium]|jgi:hypothetical protein
MIYYIDSQMGSDLHPGTSQDRPWATLSRASSHMYGPGDAILLKKGSVFKGQLALKGSGAEGKPCIISSYGNGERPAIEANGAFEAALLLENNEYWEVTGLEISNTGSAPAAKRTGILCRLSTDGIRRHIAIRDNYIHDVNGSNVKKDGDRANGIAVRAGDEGSTSRYDDVLIEGNRLKRCDRVGISVKGMYARDRWNPLRRVTISRNVLEDIGGDGIVNIGTIHCLVSRNVIRGGRMRDDMYCAGIWPWSSDFTRIEYNEVSGFKGTRDGQGFDCDYNCIGTIHYGNYSHDNEGGYMLVCTADQKVRLPKELGCVSSRIDRNLSVNDLCRTFHLAGPIIGTSISDNCIYVGKGIDIPCILATGEAEPMGGPLDTMIYNNVFAARGILRYARSVLRKEDGTFDFVEDPNIANLVFAGNAHLGNNVGHPKESTPPVHAKARLEEIEEILLDKFGKARSGIETLFDIWKYLGYEPDAL